jgi:malonate transporter MadL subunit
MEIYGFGLVAICMYIGSFIGMSLGNMLGISGNVGGVGFAMLLLVVITNYKESKGQPLSERTQNGIRLLSALYIPIIVAMAARQNVVAAFDGGAVAFLAGGVATIGAILLVPVISKLTVSKDDDNDEEELGGTKA